MSVREVRELIAEAREVERAGVLSEVCAILSMRAERCFEQDRPREAAELLRAVCEIAPPDAESLAATRAVLPRLDAYAESLG